MDSCWDTRETLLKRVIDPKDEISWNEFIVFYENYIYQLVRKMEFSHHDTEEIVQEVFVKVWKKLKDFCYEPSKGRFRGWLCITTRNTAIDFIRKSKRFGNVRELCESDQEDICMPEMESIAESEWRLYLSNQAWINIKDDYTDKTVKLFEMISKAVDTSVISKELGVSENTIYNAKHRLTKRMQAEVKQLMTLLDI